MKRRILSVLLVFAMLLAMMPMVMAYTHDWDDAYESTVLKNTDKWGCKIQVLDVDMDGSPELLIGGAVGSGVFSSLESAYSYQNGSAVKLGQDTNMFICLGSTYEMYRNTSTGAYRLEESFLVRAGAGYYYDNISVLKVENGTITVEDVFTKATEGSSISYYQQKNNLWSEDAYNAAISAWNSGWEKVDDFVCVEKYFSKKPTSAELKELFAQYPASATPQPVMLTVSISAQGNGTVSGAGEYKEGDAATLTAVPTAGHRFVGWYSANGNLLSDRTTITISVRSDTSLNLTAKFEVMAPPYDEVSTANGSLSNFRRVNTYSSDQFTDVIPGAWYEENVQAAYEYGLVLGYGDGVFGVGTDISIAQVIAIADRLHNRYYGGSGVFDQTQADTWYRVYMDYAVKYGIISAGQYDPLATATRTQFATILSKALPDEALNKINDVNALPDVKSDDPYLPAILRLYNAGILTGSDEYGTFEPEKAIGREQVAAMATRVADVDLRHSLELKKINQNDHSIYREVLEYAASENIVEYRDYSAAAFHDLNGDGVDELIMVIRAKGDYEYNDNFILSIYGPDGFGKGLLLYTAHCAYVVAPSYRVSMASLNGVTYPVVIYRNYFDEGYSEQWSFLDGNYAVAHEMSFTCRDDNIESVKIDGILSTAAAFGLIGSTEQVIVNNKWDALYPMSVSELLKTL